ncbi:elongation factor 1-beta 2-like [Brassica napus]|uniref:elongation factor 1-beta 2-like n=1 Tax=Brassica napus TaxID=3708 RepID=UPI002079B1CC|nr:elongation factor 1-beta 2-like [Brassica napus]
MNSNGKAIVSDDPINSLRKKLCLRFAFRKTYIAGDKLPVDDVKVYVAVVEKPSDAFPSASNWYDCLAYHLLKVTNFGIVASSPAPAADDDDDMDPFGDETEEEKKAAEEKEGAKKDTKKPKGRKMKSAADLTRRLMKAETDVQPEALKGRRNL